MSNLILGQFVLENLNYSTLSSSKGSLTPILGVTSFTCTKNGENCEVCLKQ